MKLTAADRASMRRVLEDTPLIAGVPELHALAKDAIRGGIDDLRNLLQSVEGLDHPRECQAALGEWAAAALLMATGEFHRNALLGDLRTRLVELHRQAKAAGVFE